MASLHMKAGIKSSVFSKLCVLQTVTLQANMCEYIYFRLKKQANKQQICDTLPGSPMWLSFQKS